MNGTVVPDVPESTTNQLDTSFASNGSQSSEEIIVASGSRDSPSSTDERPSLKNEPVKVEVIASISQAIQPTALAPEGTPSLTNGSTHPNGTLTGDKKMNNAAGEIIADQSALETSADLNGHAAAISRSQPELTGSKAQPSTLEEWAAKASSQPSTIPSSVDATSSAPIHSVISATPASVSSAPVVDSKMGINHPNDPSVIASTSGRPMPTSLPAPHSQTQQAAFGSRNPPYHPPPSVMYPSERVSNPFYDCMDQKPNLEGVAHGNLFRPEYFPTDIDSRLDRRSIWMGVDRHTFEAKYFVPATCGQCASASRAQHCDRGFPSCTACHNSGMRCESGRSWRHLRVAKRKSRTSASDRGSVGSPAVTSSAAAANVQPLPPVEGDDSPNGVDNPTEQTGRGKRVKKKRRLDDGLDLNHPDTSTVSIPSHDNSLAYSFAHIIQHKPAKKPRQPFSLDMPKRDPPRSAEDKAYFARVDANASKPSLKDMKSTCPVWAETRRALCSAAEYLQNPVKTVGASVEIGQGGVARGVILEGQSPGQWDYWGTGAKAGTILASIGKPRPMRKSYQEPVDREQSIDSPDLLLQHDNPSIDVRRLVANGTEKSVAAAKDSADKKPLIGRESHEIEALCLAQKYRSPVAIAVSHDYSETPFKVPRNFVVLGWFWVVDAWVEPVTRVPNTAPHVQWKFRFEWCEPQDAPWWSARSDPDRENTPTLIKTSQPPALTYQQLSAAHTTIMPPAEDNKAIASDMILCEKCNLWSRSVYSNFACLNESCDDFFRHYSSQLSLDALLRINNEPNDILPMERISPEMLGLKLRPDVPGGVTTRGREHAGQEWWKAWVCDICGMANERRDWFEWACGACKRKIQMQPKAYDAFFLRDPSRPVCTGPRQDDGMPDWPAATTISWTLFQDDIKVIKHGVDTPSVLGKGTELFHALNTEGQMSHVAAGMILRLLQAQSRGIVPFRRVIQPHTTNRPSERYLSPFHTVVYGVPARPINSVPTDGVLSWSVAPQPVMDAADLVNERAGRMWPETKEFNSLLIAAFPPALPAGLAPRIVVEANTHFAFLFLGSDGEIRFKRRHSSGKAGTLRYQHGDVIGLKAGEEAIEVILKPDGFGFVCIGRQIFKQAAPQVIDKDAEFPALPQPLPSTLPKATPRQSIDAPKGPTSVAAPSLPGPNPANGSRSKPKEKLLEKASLNGWYIGSRPLNDNEPLRVVTPSGDRGLIRPTRWAQQPDEFGCGKIVYIREDEAIQLETFSPVLPAKAEVTVSTSSAKKGKKAEVPGAIPAENVVDVDGDVSMDVASPASGSKKKRAPAKKPRISSSVAPSVGETGDSKSVEDTASVASGISGKGGKGKAKGRASNGAAGGSKRGKGRPSGLSEAV